MPELCNNIESRRNPLRLEREITYSRINHAFTRKSRIHAKKTFTSMTKNMFPIPPPKEDSCPPSSIVSVCRYVDMYGSPNRGCQLKSNRVALPGAMQ